MDKQGEKKNTLLDPDEMFRDLIKKISENCPGMNLERIRDAYEMAKSAHEGQLRKDGSPYVTHCVAAADITVDMGMDEDSVVSALLHDVIEDTNLTHADIARQFGTAVADIVEGVTKLTRVQYTSKEDEQMENLRKMLMAMSKDIRVILIKIADRLHNMRTMAYQSPEKQRSKSLETMEIYAPIAHRLGMQRAKWELEDLSLQYLDPAGYNEITSSLEKKMDELERFMESVEGEDTDEAGRRRRQVHHLLPHKACVQHLPENVRPEAGHQRHFRPLRLPGDSGQYPGLLQCAGHYPRHVQPGARALQGLYIHPQAQHVPERTHHRHRQRGHTLRGADTHLGDALHAEYGIAAHWKYKMGSSASTVQGGG